ncbi:Hpt domain-containing protein [Thiomicrorhabdus sediminis]|uniref:HPt domain-containing protein n=1 Tax=Thiomicrorhabdus sediminis TaxID=2580412 RepID=A0A4P9K4Q0_9GAMM|nr:Hpt domain-containing protein [Thiomicrorhabdus sediminis]QCU89898.1 hypothetical protein FE785_04230 [Thiomicrorhabdus sediminis]
MIDFEKFEAQFGMNKDDFLMFLDEFEQRLTDDLPELESLLAQLDFPKVSAAAHKLKTPAATLGLTNLNSLFLAMETNAKSEPDIDFLKENMKKIEEESALFRKELNDFKS